MNNSRFFNIPTTVKAEFEGKTLIEVKITAVHQIRQKIWSLVVNDWFNPGLVWYNGGIPTAITLGPNPGCTSFQTTNMAYALACLATVEHDGLDLFGFSLDNMTANKVVFQGFVPNLDAVREFQRLYIHWKAMDTLRSRLHGLKFEEGLNTGAIYAWHDEAVEALRRLYGEPRNYEVEAMVDQVGDYAKTARVIDALKSANWHFLETEIASFEMAINANSQGLDLPIPAKYAKIVEKIEGEAARLRAEVESFRPTFDKIQHELMVAIRKATPPTPPALKRK